MISQCISYSIFPFFFIKKKINELSKASTIHLIQPNFAYFPTKNCLEKKTYESIIEKVTQ